VATAAIAQSPSSLEVKAPDGRTVILKPDGTWEYKKAAPSPSPKPVIPNAASEAVSPNFSGDDQTALLIQLVDLRKRLVKSEFETTAAYETRAAEEKQKPILGDRTIQDTFSFAASGVQAEYNADSQTMTFFLPVNKNILAEALRGLKSTQDKKSARDLSRVSLYNISLKDSDDSEVFFDWVSGFELSDKNYSQGFSAKVVLDVEEAKRLKAGVKAIVLVQFEEPYAIETYSSKVQFQTRLIDVQFFDQKTGKVLAKMGAAPTPTLTSKPADVGKNALLEKAQARHDVEALTELRRVVTIEPTNAEAYLLTGGIQLQRDDQEAAIATLKTALFWDPKLIDGHILLGRIFLARGDREEAKKYVTAALTLDPNNQEALALQRQILR
jgi:tetratricopeptide (TPR) repeat protein